MKKSLLLCLFLSFFSFHSYALYEKEEPLYYAESDKKVKFWAESDWGNTEKSDFLTNFAFRLDNINYPLSFSLIDKDFDSSESIFADSFAKIVKEPTSFPTDQQVLCEIPPVAIIANGIATNLVDGIVTVRASDFDIASSSPCSTISSFSFSADVNDTEKTFDCNNIGFQIVEIWITDNAGNNSITITYVVIADNLNSCGGGSGVSCQNDLIVYNGLATALSNLNTSIVKVEDLIKREEENCTGENILSFESDLFSIVYTADLLGTRTVKIQSKIEGNIVNEALTYVLVQDPLTVNTCIPVPIVFNGLTTSLNYFGSATINAAAFNAVSYSDCGGALAFSFSADVNDQQRTFDCNTLGTQSVEIWVTDMQTNTQNRVFTYISVQDNIGACSSDCPNTYIFSEEETVNAGIYQASDHIHFKNVVDFPEKITLMAGNYISLLPGTHIQANSDFLATIEACTNLGRKEAQETMLLPIINREEFDIATVNNKPQLKAYPNPFQTQTTIKYYLPKSGKVNLQILDFLGRQIAILEPNAERSKGWHQLKLQSKNMQTGTYFLALNNNGFIQTEKIVIVR